MNEMLELKNMMYPEDAEMNAYQETTSIFFIQLMQENTPFSFASRGDGNEREGVFRIKSGNPVTAIVDADGHVSYRWKSKSICASLKRMNEIISKIKTLMVVEDNDKYKIKLNQKNGNFKLSLVCNVHNDPDFVPAVNLVFFIANVNMVTKLLKEHKVFKN
nr:hypothetical protein [uncultured Mediterraneibacter sp.]